jgi:RNA recognition motif-containing protein
MLHEWGSRFGDIASSKSIIDHRSSLCKGFGFIKYHNFEDAENCIRGFHHLGYEVSFARVSLNNMLWNVLTLIGIFLFKAQEVF